MGETTTMSQEYNEYTHERLKHEEDKQRYQQAILELLRWSPCTLRGITQYLEFKGMPDNFDKRCAVLDLLNEHVIEYTTDSLSSELRMVVKKKK